MILKACLLFLVASSFLRQNRDGSGSLEVEEEKVVSTNPRIKPSFPGIDSETCDESCSPHIIAPLYQHWNEDSKSLEDPPFSPILYWKDKNRDPISYLESTEVSYQDSWACPSGPDCRNLAWYMEHCHFYEDRPLSGFNVYTDGADLMAWLTWHRSSCEDLIGPNGTVLEENVPFLGGRVNGTVAIVNNETEILFPDPSSNSCWNPFCFDKEYSACLEDAQLGLVEVSLDVFVGIKDVYCE